MSYLLRVSYGLEDRPRPSRRPIATLKTGIGGPQGLER